MNKYEQIRVKRVKENKAKFDELGLGKYGTNLNPPTVQNFKGKDKEEEDSDHEYVLENVSLTESDDSPKVYASVLTIRMI